jgi:2-amino-4-hydroxy-6-hydroxymethyldihydropteridine diphosphokinase
LLSARLRTPERTVVLSLGSNLGSREERILAGASMLARTRGLRLEAMSSLYETSPVGIVTEHTFINAVIAAKTAFPAAGLLDVCRAVERSLGRTEGGPSRDRTLDIDIILCGDEEIDEPGLTVPHPRFRERRFVLEPLAEILPAFRVPPAGEPVADILRSCGGDAWARKVSGRLRIR